MSITKASLVAAVLAISPTVLGLAIFPFVGEGSLIERIAVERAVSKGTATLGEWSEVSEQFSFVQKEIYHSPLFLLGSRY